MKDKINFIKALAVFTGTIVGAGVFGLPYVAFKAGFFVVFFYFIILGALAITIHFLLGEVSKGTKKIARVPGYAEEYLGKGAKKFSFVVSSLGLMGALLAYLILGGQFLYSLFSNFLGGSVISYTLFFFALGAFLIYRGTKNIAQFEIIMSGLFVVILFLFFFRAFNFINLENFLTFNVEHITFPYGVILFSLWGLALVPEISEMVYGDRKKLRQVLSWGIIIAAVSYLFFIFIILGASGKNTSIDAISGFSKSIGNGVLALGFVFGLITTFTSFITLGLTLKKIFWYDFKISKNISWVIACFTPLFLYFIGFKNFIDVIGITGAVMIGLESIIVIFIYKSFIQKKFHRSATRWLYPLIILLFLGVAFELFYFFIGFK